MNTNPAKPGYATSELYLTLFSIILTALVGYGLISTETANFILNNIDPVIKAITMIYTGSVMLVTIFGLARQYILSRTAIKTKLLQTPQPTA